MKRFKIRQKTVRRVLMVEDEEHSGLLLQKSLQAIDKRIKINWVTTAEEAEAILKKDHGYDLIISDHLLEGKKTGLELWQTCHNQYRATPFLLTSSFDLQMFFAATGNDYVHLLFLHKPFQISECKDLVEFIWSDVIP